MYMAVLVFLQHLLLHPIISSSGKQITIRLLGMKANTMSLRVLPGNWVQLTHPEGQPYYYVNHPGLKMVCMTQRNLKQVP